MKSKSGNSEAIQKYLANELTKEELANFEEMVKVDPQLQDDIRIYRKVSDSLRDDNLKNFKIGLERIHQEQFGSDGGSHQINYKPWYLVAAIFLILITIGSVVIYQSGSEDTQTIFSNYYSPIEISNSRNIENGDNVFDLGIELYKNAQYTKAFEKFYETIKLEEDNYAARLYLAICSIETENTEIAKEQLEIILESKDPFYIQDAQWYQALLFIKLEKMENAISKLTKIKNGGGVYAERASLILKEIH